MWVGRNGKELGTLPEFNQMGGLGVSLSHDDAFVAWTQGSEDLWRFEVDRGISTPFTFEPGVDLRPVWEPAGRRVVYSSYRDGDFDLFVKSTTGSGGGERLLKASGSQMADDWSPDGRFILYTQGSRPERGAADTRLSETHSPSEIWALPLDGLAPRTAQRVVRTEGVAATVNFRPVGHGLRSSRMNRIDLRFTYNPFRTETSSGSRGGVVCSLAGVTTVKNSSTSDQTTSSWQSLLMSTLPRLPQAASHNRYSPRIGA